MFKKLMTALKSDNTSEICNSFKQFAEVNSGTTSFPELNENGNREELWGGIFRYLNYSKVAESDKVLCLSALKILIRDKTQLSSLVTDERLKSLMKLSHLTKKNVDEPNYDNQLGILESVKCLYNLILNMNPVAKTLCDMNAIEPLIGRLADNDNPNRSEIKMFDLKLLFLLTAFVPSTRLQIFRLVGGLSYFNGTLSSQLESAKGAVGKTESLTILSDELKVLFNVLSEVKGEDSNVCLREDWENLVAILREYLNEVNKEAAATLTSDVINLFTLIPINSLGAITTKAFGDAYKHEAAVEAAGLAAITKVMDYLDKNLASSEESKTDSSSYLEVLPPVLLALLDLAKSRSVIRKHIRQRIFPKLTEKEVFTRPEEGNTMRNKLCRLLTSPISHITNLTADLLFVLCKESVGRMVKYTGYGNAAGLFARRGLMSRPLEYSSDSEGSDSEEYNKHKEFINPVVGCRTPAHPDPMEGMTEEQKEVLALELVNKVDQLMRDKIIQPCIVGEDGRPLPIEHVQQLQTARRSNRNEDVNYSDDD